MRKPRYVLPKHLAGENVTPEQILESCGLPYKIEQRLNDYGNPVWATWLVSTESLMAKPLGSNGKADPAAGFVTMFIKNILLHTYCEDEDPKACALQTRESFNP